MCQIERFMKKLWLIFILILFPSLLFAAMPVNPSYVSPTGSGSACTNVAPCTLSYANTNAAAGDTVYLKGGNYSTGIIPSSNGSAGNVITFAKAPGETPIITGTTYASRFDGKSYIKIDGITMTDNNYFSRIENGSHHIELTNCTMINSLAYLNGRDILGIWAIGLNPNWVTHIWIHHNTIAYSNRNGNGCTDGGGDLVQLGNNHDGASVPEDNNYMTLENNHLYGFSHGVNVYGKYTVIKNNVFHNEPWSSGCATTGTWPNSAGYYTNAAYTGKYSHGCLQINDDANRTGIYDLVEGNRIGHAGANQTNDGAVNLKIAGLQNIIRYNSIYNAMESGVQFKYTFGGGNGQNGGTYNRFYNNTIYHNGWGYDYYHTCPHSTCPEVQAGIDLYTPNCSQALGNIVKNNIIYDNHSYYYWGTEFPIHGGGYGSFYSCFGTNMSSNFCTSGESGCNKSGDPKFTNPDLTSPSSLTLPDLTLQSSSPAIDGGTYLTTATNSGSNSTTLTVADALYFQDGTWGADMARGVTLFPDWIAIGTVSNVVQISSISYGTYSSPAGTIILASPMTWSNGASIWLYKNSSGTRVLYGSAPDYGAYELGFKRTLFRP